MKLLIISLSLLFSHFSIAADKNCENYKMYSDVSMTEMNQIVKDAKATIIDANSNDSFLKSHIPSAVHFASNKKNLEKVLPEDKNTLIVAYCGGKMCTAWQQAAAQACKLGYKNIRHFSEGITGWNKSSKG